MYQKLGIRKTNEINSNKTKTVKEANIILEDKTERTSEFVVAIMFRGDVMLKIEYII